METRIKRYYEEHWPTIILECMKFKQPCIANLESMSSYMHEPDATDADKDMYFYVDFVTPGKNYYCVKFDGGKIEMTESDEDDNMPKPVSRKPTIGGLM